ncbi:MAG: hypothetical protein HGA33_05290 [Candidatus Moranbacteria bacterium]|nr:hypothetical protein [Candidatus Moranbacteria bacterium]
MALEATHLRFALDVRDDYHVADLSRYLSGAIYPDSRYASGIDRLLTHPREFSDIPLPTSDDFRKGWETHLIYDLLQGEVFSGMSERMRGGVRQGDDVWKERTACKIIQNEIDFGFLEIAKVLPYIGVIVTPFDERPELVKRYHDAVSDVFRGAKDNGLRRRLPILDSIGSDVRQELVDDLLLRCDRIQNDTDLMAGVSGIYDRTMKMYRERYRKFL